MKLLDEKGLTTVWAAIKNTFTSKSDADGKYAKKSEIVSNLVWDKRGPDLFLSITTGDGTKISEFMPTASSSTTGAMSNTDKAKLDGIASGANNYTLPAASATTLGGIKTDYNDTADASKWAVKVDNNSNAYVPIQGLNHYSNNIVSGLVVRSSDNSFSTSYNAAAIAFASRYHGGYTCYFPTKGGTFALTSDLSDLCKFNFINSISECQNGKINFLYHNTNDNIDLNFLDNLQDGLILFIVSSIYGREASHSSSEWFYNTNSYQGDTHYTVSIKVGQVFLATKYNGQIHLFSIFK